MKKATRQSVSLSLGVALSFLPSAFAYDDPYSALKNTTQQAKQAYVSHDYAGAVSKYQQALKLAQGAAPKVFIILYSNLGAAFREGHQFNDAQSAFKSAIACAEKAGLERDPSATNAMRQYATLLRRMGNNVDAELMESRASGSALVIPITPAASAQGPAEPPADAKLTMAPPVFESKSADKSANASIDQLKQMMADRPDDKNIYEALAYDYTKAANWPQAIAVLQMIDRRFHNQDKQVHHKIAYCYRQNGDVQNAIAETQGEIAANPNDADDYVILHQLYIDLGDINSAIETDRAFLEKFPNDANAPMITNVLASLTKYAPPSGDKPNAQEQRENWPDYYFPLKVYMPPVDESYKFAKSTTGMIEQTPAEVLSSALDAWARASHQRVTFTTVQRPEDASIEVTFTNNPNGLESGRAGQTEWVQNTEHQKVRVIVLLVHASSGKPVTPEILMNTSLHELGHALGLQHSNVPDDIMYPALHGTPQTALSEHDSQRVTKLYTR